MEWGRGGMSVPAPLHVARVNFMGHALGVACARFERWGSAQTMGRENTVWAENLGWWRGQREPCRSWGSTFVR